MSAAHNSVRRRLLLGGAAVAGLTAAGAAAGSAVMARADFGALPTGERLKRIQASPHWQDGSFHNLVPMELSASGRSRLEIMRDFLLDRNPQRFPSVPVPHIKTHFAAVPDNHMVWLGHSGFFIHWAGLKLFRCPGSISLFRGRTAGSQPICRRPIFCSLRMTITIIWTIALYWTLKIE